MNKPIVTMMGLGYIGLPTAALIASKGISVKGVDIKKEAVDTINQGKIHIIEPDLEGLVKVGVEKGFLKAYTSPSESDVYLIAVPTPFKANYEPDISYVASATEMLLPFLKNGNLLIIESTSPVGTTEEMAKLIFSKRPELKDKIYIAYCPERVLPGQVIYELEQNDRSIGGINKESTVKAMEFYSLFVKGTLHPTNARTAEMCKLVENSFRDVNIAFANELSIICEKSDIDVWELIELANKHPRVKILNPGVGVGGHCIAVDPWFLVSQFGDDAKMIKNARQVNDRKPHWVKDRVIEKAKQFEQENGRKPVIGCLGLAYKPDIDDLRESPSVEIAVLLKKEGYKLYVNEPHTHLQEAHGLTLSDIDTTLKNSDMYVLLTPHAVYKKLRGNIDFDKKLVNYSLK